KWIARKVAVVSQEVDWNISLTVHEIVSMGRYPYGEKELRSEYGAKVVYDAMASVNVEKFMERVFSELSSGEAQRVLIARALAQQPEFLLLDEPISHLDVYHQIAVLELCKKIVKDGMTVVAVLHDLNMASWFADVIILLYKGRVKSVGSAPNVLCTDVVQEVFGVDMIDYNMDGRLSVLVPRGVLRDEGR
ncbi:MAG: ABC transporter ATP-binding protein, partial [Synergistetes bacterium]|nr:ABC transporter ATP-binding protein [Synergistota bacterium]